MNRAVEQIARAVLYEGYLLYPYRHSALKNQQRWNFGVLYPSAWAARQNGPDRAWLQMECLVRCGNECRVAASLRFLHLIEVESGGRSWQEAGEREVVTEEIHVDKLVENARVQGFEFAGAIETRDGATRLRKPVEGRMEVKASRLRDGLIRLRIRVTNTTRGVIENRNDALMLSLPSAHVVVSIINGQLVSLTDPPDDLHEEAAACQNTGVWPVLVGQPGSANLMLGSPIILYDYPQVAPESRGDLFDGTEIDEILTLRILTLTDQEKDELRRTDERARRLLERLETAPQEHILDLHGAIRAMRGTAVADGKQLTKGIRVRLRPRRRADVFDSLLEGKIAIIEAVEEDFDGTVHVAVVLEDDPGRDLGELRQAGHRFFYGIEEIEPMGEGLTNE